MMKRSDFGLVLACLLIGQTCLLAGDLTLRLAAANATSGKDQSYDPGHGVRILKALAPDVVMIQEFRYLHGSIADLVKEIGGAQAFYFRESGFDQGLPNGIISRYPIKEAGSWNDPKVANRGFAWARIDIPGDRDLLVVSVHLKASNAAPIRKIEAEEIVARIKATAGANDHVAIGGDFNTSSRTEDCLRAFSAVVSTAAPYPADQKGKDGTSQTRDHPYDWVLVSDALDTLAVPVVIGSQKFPDGLVFDSRVAPQLFPPTQVEPGDSCSENMQHMVVVRDFKLGASAILDRCLVGRGPGEPTAVQGKEESNLANEVDDEDDVLPSRRTRR